MAQLRTFWRSRYLQGRNGSDLIAQSGVSVRAILGLYRIYWQKAPENGSSRTPLVAMGLLLGVALSALLVAFLFVRNV